MRDFVVLAGLLAFLPLAMMRLHIAVLLWTWIALMAPHRMTYGFVYFAPINKIIAVISLIAVFVSPDKKRLPGGLLMTLIIIFFTWTTVTTLVSSSYPEQSIPDYFIHIFPVFIHTFLVMLCINSKDRLHAFIWIVAISLGWHGAKMGLVTIIEGGSPASNTEYGPAGTLITDRNHFSLAIVMLFPILFYLYTISSARLTRLMILGVAALSVLSVLGSFSRGGLIALIAMAGVLWWRSKHKIGIAVAIFVVAASATLFLPDEFRDRMSTITEQFEGTNDRFEVKEFDLSFAQRLATWRMGQKMIEDSPITGQGLRAIQNPRTPIRFAVTTDPLYGTQWYKQRAAHNIYIQVASDSGLTGLVMYLGLFFVTVFNCQWIMRQTKTVPELQHLYMLTRLIPVSLAGYAVGGAALSMAYYDGFFMVLLMVVAARRLVLEHQGKVAPRHIILDKEYRLKKRFEDKARIEQENLQSSV